MTSFAKQDNIGTIGSSRGVFESLSKFIKVTDKDESTGLENFCYASETPIDEEFNANRDLINECRGVVFDGEKVVMKAFSYTEEQGPDIDMVGKWFDGNDGFENCRFYESHEGALIRMFYFKDKWFLTTHRKLNAFKSKWGSDESYGASFKNALRCQIDRHDELGERISHFYTNGGNYFDAFKCILDKNKQYMFLVRNTHANRLVCNGSVEPTMYHVGTFEEGKLDLDHSIGVNKPTELKFATTEEMMDHVNNVNPAETPGVIIFSNNNKQLKVSNRIYLDLLELRGNQPSIKFRYLQVRMNESSRGMLQCLYPEHVSVFDEYEEYLGRAVRNIHNSYMDRFIHKKHVHVSQAEFAVIRVAHNWFMEGRTNDEPRRVTYGVIGDILNEQQATTLNQIIKKIKHDDHIEMQDRVEEAECEHIIEPME